MIKSCDVGSLPLIGNVERFLEGAERFESSPTDGSAKYFEKRVVKGFLDKLNVGLDVANYPQFRDMSRMFLRMIDGVEKAKDGYMETRILSLRAEESCIPEVSVVRENSQQIYERISEPFQVKVCVTGPYTLSSLFIYRDKEIFSRLGEMISQIVENNLFKEKYGSVSLVAIDEPIFGLLDDPLIDRGSEGREHLQKAWESIFHRANSKGIQTCIHLHNTADELFWEVESLNIIESHVDDPIYQTGKTKELLESTDKFLKASVCITDFDHLIRESITAVSQQKMKELTVNEKIAEAWRDIRSGKMDSKAFLESEKSMKERLTMTVNRFGVERILYAGPECGLGGFPTYECAMEYLRRVSNAIKKASK
jgi:5-methyltetrahydropteroyltriglutamate--homocysteine methyltransferase